MSDIAANPAPRRARQLQYLPLGVVAAAALVWAAWLLSTPAGLLGKADAIGYAVCHRIDGRSFHLGSRALPLCARCTGMYLGVWVGLGVMAVRGGRRAAALPPRPVLAVLLGFIALMGIDGVNSYASLFPGVPALYAPQNWLRLITGTLTGLSLAALIYPVFNQTLWSDWEARPALAGFGDLLWMVALAAGVVALVLSGWDVVLYPLALLSAAGVVVILTAMDVVIVLSVVRRESQAAGWGQAALPLVAASALAVLQIGIVDAARFAVFGTWAGLPLPG
jgi:uncharacterized membrane protein